MTEPTDPTRPAGPARPDQTASPPAIQAIAPTGGGPRGRAAGAPARPAEPASTPAIEAIARTGVGHRVVRTAVPESAEESAALQGIPLEAPLRTIVVRRAADDYLFVLVPAGRRFDWPKLR